MKKTNKREFTQADAELLDKLISRLGQLILWDIAFGLGTIVSQKIEILEARLIIIRTREGKDFPKTIEQSDFQADKKFFTEFSSLLDEFVAREGLGTEYDKRRASALARSSLKEMARD